MQHTGIDANAPPPSPPQPDSRQDRAGTLVPKNVAQLLSILQILREFGRHLAATIEHRATRPGFSLFTAVFGTARLPVILAHLHRGTLRATALESLLLTRAATGRDVIAAPPHTDPTPTADLLNETLAPQAARLAADRARHDAPLDPDHLPTSEQVEAEVRHHPIGRTIAAICRDFGIVPIMCAYAFWDATAQAIAVYQDSAATCDEHLHTASDPHEPEGGPHQRQMRPDNAEESALEPTIPRVPMRVKHRPGFKICKPSINPCRIVAKRTSPRAIITRHESNIAANATGPPLTPKPAC